MNIGELNGIILMLNREGWEGELEHHGSATTRFELRSNGEDITIWFLGHRLWWSGEDERQYLAGESNEQEPIESFIRRESRDFLIRITASPSNDIPFPTS